MRLTGTAQLYLKESSGDVSAVSRVGRAELGRLCYCEESGLRAGQCVASVDSRGGGARVWVPSVTNVA